MHNALRGCARKNNCFVTLNALPPEILGAIFEHLDRREASRKKSGGPTRFERGDTAALRRLRNRVHELAPAVTVVVCVGLGMAILDSKHRA